MKKLVTLLLALVATTALWATEITVDGIAYDVDGDSAIVKSKMWEDYTGDIVIPSTITHESQTYRVVGIKMMAFMFDPITSITISEGVTFIRQGAFSQCSRLKSVKLPQSMVTIEKSAFNGCDSLPVENNMRYADTYLVKMIDNKQTSATIKDGTRWIGSDAFQGAKFKSITLPKGLLAIGDGAFFSCFSLTGIEIPASVIQIDTHAFSLCRDLASIKCYAVEPPVCGTDAFSSVTKSIPVHVPTQSVNAYKAADEWKDFTKIYGDLTPIDDVKARSNTQTTKIMKDGKVLIQSNGRTFTLTGSEL